MSNFAKEQLLKYGWTEGKGLGKNENGITEPVKLATTQNKEGIGYDEYETPWWEKVYNDASKNIKIESIGDQVTLTAANNTNAGQTHGSFDPLKKSIIYQKAFMSVGSLSFGTVDHPKIIDVTDQKQHGSHLNAQSQLNATPARENTMAYRKTNAESDVESSEHEVDTINANLNQLKEGTDFYLSKSTKKKYRKKMKNLEQQLSTCNLDNDNFVKCNIVSDRKWKLLNMNVYELSQGKKLSQKKKMRKIKEEIVNSNKLNHLITKSLKTNRTDEIDEEWPKTIPLPCMKLVNPHSNQKLRNKHLKDTLVDQQTRLHNHVKKLWDIFTEKHQISELKWKNEKDSIKPKVKPNLELTNNTGEVTTEQDCIINIEEVPSDIEEKIQQGNVVSRHVYFKSLKIPKRFQGNPQKMARNYIKYKCIESHDENSVKTILRTILEEKEVSKKCTKIQKQRNVLFSLKKKIAQCSIKKTEQSTRELNMDSVIKDLEKCGLVEQVNIKKRSTQTHLTPV
ncbi:uncharacterized protein LOC105836528 [Monomorium pharaonis]|uniref:uncharacterized protein LOC105836528 n=1 Tax=Monomorium pharaonis TaxID=307658 RepID=UPI00063F24A8|nr:uncharacterized protein LOC105836528 [Monomorium pharaonis]